MPATIDGPNVKKLQYRHLGKFSLYFTLSLPIIDNQILYKRSEERRGGESFYC